VPAGSVSNRERSTGYSQAWRDSAETDRPVAQIFRAEFSEAQQLGTGKKRQRSAATFCTKSPQATPSSHRRRTRSSRGGARSAVPDELVPGTKVWAPEWSSTGIRVRPTDGGSPAARRAPSIHRPATAAKPRWMPWI